MARSGGTLLATMLGAHSMLAMSYEIYEEGLSLAPGVSLNVKQAIHILEEAERAARGKSWPSDDDRAAAWIAGIPKSPFRAFAARAHRGGLQPRHLVAELHALLEEGGTFDTVDERLDYIDRLMKRKMILEGKPIWGGKAKAALRDLVRRHPTCAVLMMVRDGRDVLASRLNTGSFDRDPKAVAREWASKLEEFSLFAETYPHNGRFVSYEHLVYEPQRVLRDVCLFLRLPYEHAMYEYVTSRPTLLEHPHGHLSAARIAEGLNDRTIGRWRLDLTAEQVKAVEAEAGFQLVRWGYEVSHPRATS